MKRTLALLCAMTFVLSGCSAWGGGGNASPDSLADRTVIETSASPSDLGVYREWGITLSVKDVTPTGATLVCSQSGGKDVTELLSGSFFVLEQEVGGVWVACETVLEEYAFTAEGWMIPLGQSVEWETDWEWLYGALTPGNYRIGKEILNFQAPGDYDKLMCYAQFTVTE